MSEDTPDQRQGDRRKGEDDDYQGKERREAERRAGTPAKDRKG